MNNNLVLGPILALCFTNISRANGSEGLLYIDRVTMALQASNVCTTEVL